MSTMEETVTEFGLEPCTTAGEEQLAAEEFHQWCSQTLRNECKVIQPAERFPAVDFCCWGQQASQNSSVFVQIMRDRGKEIVTSKMEQFDFLKKSIDVHFYLVTDSPLNRCIKNNYYGFK